jgi:hypothetical protein
LKAGPFVTARLVDENKVVWLELAQFIEVELLQILVTTLTDVLNIILFV